VELPSVGAIKLLVERGTGVALVPRLSAEAEIAAGTLKALRVRELRLERKLNIIYRRNSELSHAARAFLEIAQSK
ncbi:MAG: LysR family transcriptional regulator, partial [Acidobacteria bacterium]|nr:LysR family transcriptional regulator [Acidobacteriota bacterium]